MKEKMDPLEKLTQIGFTEYEAKVYLALLRDHPANGYQLSKKSGVPRSMVYEALARLHGRGAVMETIEDRAALYRPLPPDVLLDQAQDEHSRLVGELRAGLHALYTTPEEEHVWTLTNRRAILSYATQMIVGARTEIFFVLSDADLDTLEGDITQACARGVALSSLLTGQKRLNCGEVAYHPPLESELQQLTGSLIIVADGHEAMIATTEDDASATVTRNRNVVLIARQFVWMELFAQRIYARLGPEVINQLEPEDRRIFESLGSE
jgi:HTH-type transcriptional regulator, sugar sensing transcriptional regulator